jgi:hypothetical protein
MPEPCCIGLLKALGGKGKTVSGLEFHKRCSAGRNNKRSQKIGDFMA